MNAFQTHGAISWQELATTNPEAAGSFYSGVFGWQTEQDDMAGMKYTEIKVGESRIGGIMPARGGAPSRWRAYVTVDDIEQAVSKAESLGGKVLVQPTEIPIGRFAVLQDPTGAEIGAIQYSDKHLCCKTADTDDTDG